MVKALFDTNILIDFLNRVPQAHDELHRYESRAISIVTWMEVMVGADQMLEAQTRQVLGNFDVIPLDNEIAERAVQLRRQHRVKWPDAVIWASANIRSLLLITRNTKDFTPDTPGVRIPYYSL